MHNRKERYHSIGVRCNVQRTFPTHGKAATDGVYRCTKWEFKPDFKGGSMN